MNSKEALKRLIQETAPATYMVDFDKDECIEVIRNELERLEQINKVWHKNEPMESVDINGNHLQEVYDFLHITIKELEKYKSAIKIMNDALELYVDFYEVGVENRSSFIDYEDSELLKEVLGYE